MPRGRPLASCNFIRGRMQFSMTPTMRRPSRICILLSFTVRPLPPAGITPFLLRLSFSRTVRYCPCNSNSLKRVICIRWNIDDTAMKKTLFLQLRRRCSPRERQRRKSARAYKCALREEKYRNETSRLRLYDTADWIVFA